MSRHYLGLVFDSASPTWFRREVFRSTSDPTRETHGQYAQVIGPFRTKRGAEWMREHGHCGVNATTVAQAELKGGGR